jgi:hypothetical protein
MTCHSSIYNYLEITVLDQNFNPLMLNDPELTLSLTVEAEYFVVGYLHLVWVVRYVLCMCV